MNRRLLFWLVWLGVLGGVVMALLWLAPQAIREERSDLPAVHPTAQDTSAPPLPSAPSSIPGAPQGPSPALVPIAQPAVAPATIAPVGSPAASSTPPVAPITLDVSPIADYWREQYGITAEDIRQTLERLRAEGVPEHILRDAGAVFVRLPRRNVHAVTIGTLDLPVTATAGEPVPYRLTGRLPDASHAFTHILVTQFDDRLVLQPLGTRSGEPAPGIEVPVELDGALDPLPAGRYRIEYPGQPANEERFLTVE